MTEKKCITMVICKENDCLNKERCAYFGKKHLGYNPGLLFEETRAEDTALFCYNYEKE